MNSPRIVERASDLPIGAGVLLAAGVFLTRLPFVWSGFGTDTDTWKFASAVREIADTGRYTASRLPGYPLMEWLCTPFAHLGPWAPNALSAVAAAACAWLTARLFARAPDGIMPWRGRPQSLKSGLIARVPPINFEEPE